VTALRDTIDADGGGALLFYATDLPATPETTIVGPPLVTVPLAAPACGVVSDVGGLATLTITPVAAQVIAGGDIVFARVQDGSGTSITDLPAGLAGSGKPVTVSAVHVYAGGELQVLSCVMWE
jgi:hypothetical protein